MFNYNFQSCKAHIVGLLLALTAVLANPNTTFAAKSEAVLQSPAVVAHLKLAPPKKLSEKVMNMMRRILPGQQTEMLPLFFLSTFGYPTYPGVSETDSVSLFALDTKGGNLTVVALVKMTRESPLRAALEKMEWQVEEQGNGWVVIAKQDADLSVISPEQMKQLLTLTQKKRHHDVVCRVYVSRLKGIKPCIKQGILEKANVTKLEDLPPDQKEFFKWIKPFADEFSAVDVISYSGDVCPRALLQTMRLRAIPQTPLAQFLSQKVPEGVPVARYVDGESPLVYLGKINMESIHDYGTYLLGKLSNSVGPNGKTRVAELKELFDLYCDNFCGTYAGNFSLDGQSFEYVGIAGGRWTNKAFVSVLDKMCNRYLSHFLAFLAQRDTGTEMTIHFQPNVFRVKGVEVHRSLFSISRACDPETSIIRSQSTYYAVPNGIMVKTSDKKTIHTVIQAVKNKKPVPHNVATRITHRQGMLCQDAVDVPHLIGGLLAVNLSEDESDLKPFLNELQSAQLEPATEALVVGQNEMRWYIKIPIDSVAKIMQTLQAMQEKRLERWQEQQSEDASNL